MTVSPPTPLGPFAEPRPSMRGRYLMRSPFKARVLQGIDIALSLVPRRRHPMPAHPERILVANLAHLGDVITSFGVLTALRRRYPDARIGMLVGGWGRVAVEKTGLVDDVHVLDHWLLSRANMTWAEKIRHDRKMRPSVLREIRAIDYQVGIDLFAFLPPAHPLFRKAGIPVRVGYTSGGFGPLLTHPVRWTDAERPMADQYRDLVDQLDPAHPFPPADFRPYRRRDTLAALPAEVGAAGAYIVVHPGAGSPSRHWGHERWTALLTRLRNEAGARRVVLTGAGAGDVAIANALAAEFSTVINMAGKASWEEFVRILADADLVICPDTATGHVAALFEVPTVSLFTGTNSQAKWGPYNGKARILMQPVLCAPCNRAGCEAMACFRGIAPDDAADAALALLR